MPSLIDMRFAEGEPPAGAIRLEGDPAACICAIYAGLEPELSQTIGWDAAAAQAGMPPNYAALSDHLYSLLLHPGADPQIDLIVAFHAYESFRDLIETLMLTVPAVSQSDRLARSLRLRLWVET